MHLRFGWVWGQFQLCHLIALLLALGKSPSSLCGVLRDEVRPSVSHRAAEIIKHLHSLVIKTVRLTSISTT